MLRRLYVGKDRTDVAQCLCLEDSLHRASLVLHDALASYRAALGMHQRLHPDRDHHHVARAHRKMSAVLVMLGAGEEARPHAEEAVAIVRRMGLHPHAFRRPALK